VASVLVLVGAVFVLAVAAPTYGVPPLDNGLGVALGFALGTATMVLLGVSLGLLAGTARSAQALGLLVFFPMWLLGAGGPPRAVMPEVMGRIADVLPLGHVASAIRESWLGTGDPGGNLLALLVWLGAAVGMVAVLQSRGGGWTWWSHH
jgi:ABC-2 type transport system permease protein